jgi:hypothetical protein
MADEYIIASYKRPGFPRTSNSERSFKTVIEYVGPQSDLEAQQPAQNTAWGQHPGRVSVSEIEPLEGTSHAIMRVECEYQYSETTNGGGQGTATDEVIYERDWEMFTRSMFEHPAFAIGLSGTYALDSEDVSDIENWRNETDATLKKDFKYTGSAGEVTLSTNAKMFARGIQLGQETFEDYAPIIRVTTTYIDGGPDNGSEVGIKDTPPAAANGPAGYEWRKSADRGTRQGGQTRFEQSEEWIGAKTVLTDKNAVYWSAP